MPKMGQKTSKGEKSRKFWRPVRSYLDINVKQTKTANCQR